MARISSAKLASELVILNIQFGKEVKITNDEFTE